jgi:hypothetical protein
MSGQGMLEPAAIQAVLAARLPIVSRGRLRKRYLHPGRKISVPCGPRSSGRASRAELLCQIILISIIMHSEPRKSWKRLRVSRRARKSANTSIAPRSTPHWTKRRGAKGKVKVQVTSAEAPVAYRVQRPPSCFIRRYNRPTGCVSQRITLLLRRLAHLRGAHPFLTEFCVTTCAAERYAVIDLQR